MKSDYEAPCSLKCDEGVSLTNYMHLPADHYVCVDMPLNATLSKIDVNLYSLTIPPVRFFHLDVSPMLRCKVHQDHHSVSIHSSKCRLLGSKFVESINGCYEINVTTSFHWIDTPAKKAIKSHSVIHVGVDPPPPFKYFGKHILESTGTLAMSVALRQIENAFVHTLAKDYGRWATSAEYRENRMKQIEINNNRNKR